MKIYRVGGSVRDELLGLPVKDRDWVVVGATPEQMVAAGYRPVGKDFPVFLHPQTHEEYALARTERKTGPGYRGFAVHAAPGVTLEEDLARRDLTINAVAVADDGTRIDPFGGARDVAGRVLRHVGPAFVEDPVRILRVARFAARFADFRVAPETVALMRTMAAAGEVDALVAERVWQELSRGLMEAKPSRMVDVLREADAWDRLLPELPAPDTAALDRAAQAALPLAARVAVLCAQRDAATIRRICERLRIPVECRELALALAREAPALPGLRQAGADALLALLERVDALRRPERLALLVQALAAMAPDEPSRRAAREAGARVLAAREAAGAIDQRTVVAGLAGDASRIKPAIAAARRDAIAAALAGAPQSG